MPKPADESTWPYMFSDDMKFTQKAIVCHPRAQRYFLALKRGENEPKRPGDWDLPGGNVLYGEDTDKSIRNEIMEESQLEVKSLMPVTSHASYDQNRDYYWLKICYRTTAMHANVVISEEHSAFEWMDVQEFSEKCKASFLTDAVAAAYTQIEN